MCVIVKWDEISSKRLCLIHRILLLVISLRALILMLYVLAIAVSKNWYQSPTSEAPNTKKAIIIATCVFSLCELVFCGIAFEAEKRRSPKRFSAWIIYIRCQFGFQVLLTVVAAYILVHLGSENFLRIFTVLTLTTFNWVILYHAWVVAEHLRGRIKSPNRYLSFKKTNASTGRALRMEMEDTLASSV